MIWAAWTSQAGMTLTNRCSLGSCWMAARTASGCAASSTGLRYPSRWRSKYGRAQARSARVHVGDDREQEGERVVLDERVSVWVGRELHHAAFELAREVLAVGEQRPGYGLSVG